MNNAPNIRIEVTEGAQIPDPRDRRLLNAWTLAFCVAVVALVTLCATQPEPYLEIVKFLPDGLIITFEVTVLSLLCTLPIGVAHGSRTPVPQSRHQPDRIDLRGNHPRRAAARSAFLHLLRPRPHHSGPAHGVGGHRHQLLLRAPTWAKSSARHPPPSPRDRPKPPVRFGLQTTSRP